MTRFRLTARALLIGAAVSFLVAAAPDQPAPDETVPSATPEPFGVWLGLDPDRAADVRAFERFLRRSKASGILPTGEILKSETSWARCGGSPFVMPPRSAWPHIVNTLLFIRARVVPEIGPVEVVSGYRAAAANACARGASHSAHVEFWAFDLVPRSAITRETMIARLCAVHAAHGARANVGLGFYAGMRFHVDTLRYRLWGTDGHRATSPCVNPRNS